MDSPEAATTIRLCLGTRGCRMGSHPLLVHGLTPTSCVEGGYLIKCMSHWNEATNRYGNHTGTGELDALVYLQRYRQRAATGIGKQKLAVICVTS